MHKLEIVFRDATELKLQMEKLYAALFPFKQPEQKTDQTKEPQADERKGRGRPGRKAPEAPKEIPQTPEEQKEIPQEETTDLDAKVSKNVAVTKDQLSALLRKVSEKRSINDVKELLGRYGARMVSELKENDYTAVLDECNALIGA